MTMTTTERHKPKRPRSSRYNGRQSHEVLLRDEQAQWVKAQMGANWSRNQVIEQCIAVAMGKVEAGAQNEDAIAASLTKMQSSIDAVASQVRTILAILNVDTKLRYAQDIGDQPENFAQHKAMVTETIRRLKGDAE